jgi:hypothetical protein
MEDRAMGKAYKIAIEGTLWEGHFQQPSYHVNI